ncbi:MAG: hypothetical protein M1822_002838 [Bathelium mastoideum]|nr:MAG: hypothetical protein M1822_002838 [Bathelium mastoideum]
MPVQVAMDTPLASSLMGVINPKLAEYGWSSGGAEDNALCEYVMLMLVNGKTQGEIASELQNDLLSLDPSDRGPEEFAQWLFKEAESLSGGSSEGGANAPSSQTQLSGIPDGGAGPAPETEMADEVDVVPTGAYVQARFRGGGKSLPENRRPTGPKSMRNGSQGGLRGRDRRMLGQLNRTLERSGGDGALHRIKGAAGAGRINSHSREPPKGPRNLMRNQPMGPQSGMGGMPMQNMAAGGSAQALMNMSPQQQMQLFAMYEEQARMMAQILSPQQQQQMFPGQTPFNPAINGSLYQNQKNPKSLFERVQGKGPKQNGHFNKRQQNGPRQQSDAMETDAHEMPTDADPSSSMDVEASQEHKDPSESVCRFNLSCTKPDCPYVHQSPAAPPGINIDLTDECTYGAACKNHKCVGKHPSPARKANFQAEQDCKFFPNCTNPSCPFRHPSTPPCRNGADCSVPGCKFSHSTVKCRFNPCTNAYCMFKHEEGQKRGKFEDKVWVSNGGAKEEGTGTDHVSERKFVQDEENEELIIPGSGASQEETQIVT